MPNDPEKRRFDFALVALAALTIGCLAFHAVFLPAYEGPDEPLHLGRISSFADSPLREAFAGEPLDGSIIRAVESRPCASAVGRIRPCPPFGSEPAAFNLLHPYPKVPDPRRDRNPENNQPPLFYFLVGLGLRTVRALSRSPWLASPDIRLLLTRAFCVGLVGLAIFGPLRAIAARRSRCVALAGLMLILLPGASESLARCANDAAVFCWSALVLYALSRRTAPAGIALLLAVGPLLKLTALPVAAFAVVALWSQRGFRAATLGAVSAVLVFPIQFLRGWMWGGTYELNRPIPGIHESLPHAALGLVRSFYTFAKTIFWLGNWSFFRAPTALVASYFLLLLALLIFSRMKQPPERLVPHAAGAAVALAGLLTFVLANRRFFGDWGGVGGWYFWGWFPWVLVAFDDTLTIPSRVGRILLATAVVFVAASNILYFRTAIRLYA